MTDALKEGVVTLQDVIHAGMRTGIGKTRTMEIARELGFGMRDIDFARAWREEAERFDKWRRQNHAS